MSFTSMNSGWQLLITWKKTTQLSWYMLKMLTTTHPFLSVQRIEHKLQKRTIVTCRSVFCRSFHIPHMLFTLFTKMFFSPLAVCVCDLPFHLYIIPKTFFELFQWFLLILLASNRNEFWWSFTRVKFLFQHTKCAWPHYFCSRWYNFCVIWKFV